MCSCSTCGRLPKLIRVPVAPPAAPAQHALPAPSAASASIGHYDYGSHGVLLAGTGSMAAEERVRFDVGAQSCLFW
jgi:hypothetical protein